MPPDAEPVMPVITFVVTTDASNGPAESPKPNNISLIGRNPGMLTMTDPNANPDATLSTAAHDDTAPKLIVPMKLSAPSV